MTDPIYITGTGVVSAIGLGKAATLEALLTNRSGVGPLRYLKTAHKEFPVGEVKLTDAEMRGRGASHSRHAAQGGLHFRHHGRRYGHERTVLSRLPQR